MLREECRSHTTFLNVLCGPFCSRLKEFIIYVWYNYAFALILCCRLLNISFQMDCFYLKKSILSNLHHNFIIRSLGTILSVISSLSKCCLNKYVGVYDYVTFCMPSWQLSCDVENFDLISISGWIIKLEEFSQAFSYELLSHLVDVSLGLRLKLSNLREMLLSTCPLFAQDPDCLCLKFAWCYKSADNHCVACIQAISLVLLTSLQSMLRE